MPAPPHRPPFGSRALRAWLAVAACAALIWTLSSESFSAAQTSRFLGPLLHWLWPDLRPTTLFRVHMAMRKAAHLSEYAVLGWLAFRALRISLTLSRLRAAALALGVVLFVSGIDEARQSFLPSRTGSLVDVCIDLTGGAFGVLVIVTLQRRFGIGLGAGGGAVR